MRLRLTLLHARPESCADGSGPDVHELEVEAPRGCSAAALAGALAAHVGDLTARCLSTGGRAVSPDAVVGRAPLLDGMAVLLSARPASAPGRAGPESALSLVAAHGPDAGRTWAIPVGRHTIGRSADADVNLDDARLSRLHAEVIVDSESVTVRDLGSTNGTRLEGRLLSTTPEPVALTSTVSLGSTELEVRSDASLPAAVVPTADGTLAVNRRPRLRTTSRTTAISWPTLPQPPPRTRIPWLAMLLPIPAAGVLSLFVGPAMLAFALLSPLLMAGTAISDRLGARKRYAAARSHYEHELLIARAQVDAACREEREDRRRTYPDPVAVLAIAAGPGAELWQRRRSDPDAFEVSVGRCSAPATFTVDVVPGPPERPTVHGVPCTVALAAAGTLGICGRRRPLLGMTRGLLGQLLVLHSPLDLEVTVVTAQAGSTDDWAFLARTPHLRRPDGRGRTGSLACFATDPEEANATLAALAREVARRSAGHATHEALAPGPALLVVLDGASDLRSCPGVAELLRADPRLGVYCLALDGTRSRLPVEARAVLDLADPARPRLHHPNASHTDLVVDLVGTWWADRLSRALAPLRDTTPPDGTQALPRVVSFSQVVPEGRDARAVQRLWQRSPPGAAAPVGMTSEGPFTIDLASDGPHALVGGTTGSGKSELLRTLVVSLAIHHPPDRLAMVLIDYKGGAAFRECARLPHAVGVVTDLDERLAERALVSLRAEVTRRERLLSRAHARDFDAYVGGGPVDALPRLLIVVDEFRALVEELPAFIDGIVRLAALGRSLGIHVVLATQRPGGVVSADIRANVNLRVALRVRDRADSEDVVDSPEAATLDASCPGRAVARRGGSDLLAFQAAHLGAAELPRQATGIRVRDADWSTVTRDWPHADDPLTGPPRTELDRAVEAVVQAARQRGAQVVPSPWLPPLPATLRHDRLPPTGTKWSIAIGLADHPDRQTQEPLVLDLAEPGHWALVGAIGSGRSSTLRAMAHGLAAQRDPSNLHVYAISSGSLRQLQALPQCGTHASVDDLPRLERLVARLADEVAARRAVMASSGHPSIGAWRAAADGSAPPPILLLVDDWEQLSHGSADGDALVQAMLALLREGESVGLKAVVAGDRSLLFGRAGTGISQRLIFRLSDPTDWALAGIAPARVPRDLPPGRALLGDGTEVQLALPTDRPPRAGGMPGGRLPLQVKEIPTLVQERDLAPDTDDPEAVVVGVGGDESVALSLSEVTDGRRWVVTGPIGSGVSSSLLVIARSLLSMGRPLAVASERHGPLDDLRTDGRLRLWCSPSSSEALVAARRQCPGLAVIVDNADQLAQAPIDGPLREIARLVDRDGGLIACGANSTALAAQYHGLAVEVARHRTGVLFGPRASLDSDLFGLRLRAEPQAPPGRGYLIRRGQAVPFQAAFAGP